MINCGQLTQGDQFKVAALYCFTPLKEETISSLLSELPIIAHQNEVLGSILLASEGINGTVCASSKGLDNLLEALQNNLFGKTLQIKVSWTPKQAFRRFKARKKAEIVTMGVADVNPIDSVGTYVEPCDWNSFLADSGTLVIDTRNEYEVAIGSFQGALNPHTESFREFPSWVNEYLKPLVAEKSPSRIAMFCTGGIRCEKATSYLKREGFNSVHHLHGGILRYFEDVPRNESCWEGECFVFDQRVALNHELMPGVHRLCHACGMPLNPEDRKHLNYIRGIQCHHCKDLFSDQDRARFAERQIQIDQYSGEILECEIGPHFD